MLKVLRKWLVPAPTGITNARTPSLMVQAVPVRRNGPPRQEEGGEMLKFFALERARIQHFEHVEGEVRPARVPGCQKQ